MLVVDVEELGRVVGLRALGAAQSNVGVRFFEMRQVVFFGQDFAADGAGLLEGGGGGCAELNNRGGGCRRRCQGVDRGRRGEDLLVPVDFVEMEDEFLLTEVSVTLATLDNLEEKRREINSVIL